MTLYRAGILVCLLVSALFAQPVTQGTLRARGAQGAIIADCPLKHTTVKAAITGMVARVNVVQDFHNPQSDKIEAVYTFPLPHDAAVESMTMRIGSRVIQGRVHRRDEAAALYKAARQSGRVAGLLEQERPNIFTQSVANILPGERIQVSLSYLQILRYQAGAYEFVFPMVVGPRYTPAGLRDAARISPPVAAEGVRPGHDISLEVAIDAGIPIGNLASPTHEVNFQWLSARAAAVQLRDEQTIPNKDFVLRYQSASPTIQDAVLAHRGAKGGFFTLILQPPPKIGSADAAPKELIFVLDTSGSMSGFPIEKAKESMMLALDGLYPQDTFNLITFSGDTEILFPVPVPATPANVRMAKLFLQTRSGRGGTEMMKAIRAALQPMVETGRLRIVCFMTDGYVGNDMQILAEIQNHPAARVFAFGIGQAVNRFLLDGMARQGRGEVEYVGLHDDGSAAARRFHERVRNPLLTDLAIDWNGLGVSEVSPARIPDLFGEKPVIVTGRYSGPLRGMATLRANVGGRVVERPIALDLPASEPRHDVLPALWARARIEDLLAADFAGAQAGAMAPDLQERITRLGLDYSVATQFTSFLAVEETTVTTGGKPRRVRVPVSLPEGVRETAVAGGVMGGFGGGVAGGAPGGVVGGIIGSVPSAAPAAPPPLPGPRQFSAPPPPPVRREEPKPVTTRLDKLDPSLAAILRTTPGVTVEIQVLLSNASSDTLAALRQLGFEPAGTAGSDLLITGRIAATRLVALTAIPAVRYIVKRE